MAFGAIPLDSNTWPINSVYVPGTGFKAVMGGSVYTDSLSNDSASLVGEITGASKNTYVGIIKDLAAVTGATDVFTLTGSATKVIKLVRVSANVEISATNVTANLSLKKHSTADTAGTTTSAGVTTIPIDSGTIPGSTATITAYTANPTLGTVSGIIFSWRYVIQLYSAAAQIVRDFGSMPGKQPTLRGTSEQFAFNLDGTAMTAAVASFMFIWTEE